MRKWWSTKAEWIYNRYTGYEYEWMLPLVAMQKSNDDDDDDGGDVRAMPTADND